MNASIKPLLQTVLRQGLCLLLVGATTFIYFRLLPVNSTTVALTFLLDVLWAATFWGLAEAIVTSIVAVLAFNFFFLPPVGTLTIQDPQNWVALITFLITAITASQLSARAQRRAKEAQARGLETERLYALGRAILLNEDISKTLPKALAEITRIFELEQVLFFGLKHEAGKDGYMGIRNETELELMKRVAESGLPYLETNRRIVPIRLGLEPIGSIGMYGAAEISETAGEAIANLLAIALERKETIDRAASAEAARQNEELRATLLDGLAHDLKTPLTGIKASVTTLLSRRPVADERTAEFLNIISEETERLIRTVSEAIEVARADAAEMKLDLGEYNVADFLEEILADRRTARERIRVSLPEELPAVDLDHHLMKLALKQLVDNALKYSPENTSIEIFGVERDDFLIISVADRGAGVNSGERSKIFDRFYRGVSGSQSAGGTGMGLAVAKKIVTAHGGDIWVSENPSGGSIFSVRIPFRSGGPVHE